MSSNTTHFIPLAKVDKKKRLVYLRATSEAIDYAGESMDYDKSKPNFQKWSDETFERSGGKSYGNIREMHSSIAAGKLSEPLIFDDENKTIDIVVYVSDDSSWQKVLDGVLTGASIGGKYGEISVDPNNSGARRYEAIPSEISLVDSPCNPDAVIQVIKSNGDTEMMKLGNSLKEVIKISSFENLLKELKTDLTKSSFSFQDIEQRVRMAIKDRVKSNSQRKPHYNSYDCNSYSWNYGYFNVTAMYEDSVVIYGYFGDDGNPYYIQVQYTISEDGIVTLGESSIVNMVPTPCHDVNGDDEALDLLADGTGEGVTKETEVKKNNIGGMDIMTKEQMEKAMNDPEFMKALEVIVTATGTDEEKAEFAKAKGCAKEEMEEEKKSKKAKDVKKEDDKEEDDDKKEEEEDGEKSKKAKKVSKAAEPQNLEKSAYLAIEVLEKTNQMLLKRIESLENQPAAGGPAVYQAVDKQLAGTQGVAKMDSIDQNIAMLKSTIDATSDMAARDALKRQLAVFEIQKTRQNPIIMQ